MNDPDDGIIIDPEFEGLCHRQTDDELQLLEASLVKHGCLNPLIVRATHNTLLDGHTRRKICLRLGIAYKMIAIELESREAAVAWIVNHQLGKRNLSDFQKRYLRGKKYLAEKFPRNAQKGLPQRTKLADEPTSERLGKEFNVGEQTIRKDGQLAAAVDVILDANPSVREMIFSSSLPRDDILAIASLPTKSIPRAIESALSGGSRIAVSEDFDRELEKRSLYASLRIRLRKIPDDEIIWFCEMLENFAKNTARG